MRRVLLAGPRLLLLPPRLLLAAVRPAALAVVRLADAGGELAASARGPRAGVSPLLFVDGSGPLVGARLWALDLFGRGLAASQVILRTGGLRLNEVFVDVTPQAALPVGLGVRARAFRLTDASFYGLAGDVSPTASAADLERKVSVVALDGAAFATLRPGGGAGRLRALVLGGAALRRFGAPSEGTAPDPAAAPRLEDGAAFVRAGLVLERLGRFDAARPAPTLDLSLGVEPAFGVDGHRARWITTTLDAALGVPVPGGASLLVRAYVAAQESWGADPVSFYDRLSLGGGSHRAFAGGRFRGGSAALASLEYRFPLLVWLDGFLFVEHGGAFEERFGGLGVASLRPGAGTGVRIFRRGRYLATALLGWGLGDGLRFAISFDTGP